MILARLSSPPRRLATVGLVALLAAACAVPTNPPAPSPTPVPTIPPVAPSYTLGPAPSGCPTSAPVALPVGTTATVTMTTNYGTIVIKVDATLGPNAAAAFTALARCGYFDNVLFHRIIPGFVIQAGDGQYARLPSLTPDKFGQGDLGWTIQDDTVTTPYVRGMLAIANLGTPNSGNSQFFIVLSNSAQSSLGAAGANNYAQFGNVTSGMDVVDRIAAIELGGDPAQQSFPPDMPLQPAVITSTTVTIP